jgi:integrase
MAKTYHPKYYAEPVKGTGHIYVHPKTGEKKTCKGVAWYIDFKTIDGKRDRKKVHDGHCTCPPRHKGACAHERLAQEALAAVLNAPAPIELTLSEAAKDRSIAGFAAKHLVKIENSRRHAVRTRQIIKLSIETFLEFCKREHLEDLNQIQRTHIEAFRDELTARKRPCGKPWKCRTINRYLGDVRAMLNKAIAAELIDRNVANSRGPSDDLYLPQHDEKPICVLTADELRLLTQLTDDSLKELFVKNFREVREMVLLFYYTGMRLGELCNLTFAQVRGNAIFIERHGEWVAKWGISRQIPLHEKAAAIIEGRRRDFPKAEYVFETANGTRFEERNVRQDVDRLFKKFHIKGDTGQGVSTHCLRHTFATTALLNNVPVPVVAEWLGHTNIEMTMRYWYRIQAMTDEHMKKVQFVE